MTEQNRTVRVKVSPQVAQVVNRDAPRELQLAAARGAHTLCDRDLATALFFLGHGADPEVRTQARRTLATLPAERLLPVAGDPDQHPQLLDFIARMRLSDPELVSVLLANPAVTEATLIHVAGHAEAQILSLLAQQEERLHACPEIVAALLENPRADESLKVRLAGGESPWPEEEPPPEGEEEAGEEEQAGEEEPAEEELNLSKYQQALELGVSEKIKIALTGDKEWRSIFLKDANKLVSSAVMKNPRITDGEVLAVAKNKSSSEELIRLITLNREWTKNYEIKKALVMHPRTPLPKALRYMTILSDKDLKGLAKSRSVSQVVVNNARRMVMAKQKKSS